MALRKKNISPSTVTWITPGKIEEHSPTVSKIVLEKKTSFAVFGKGLGKKDQNPPNIFWTLNRNSIAKIRMTLGKKD
jgi:hypothetical protein